MKKIFLTIYIFTSLFFLGCKKDPPEQVGQPVFSSLSFSVIKDTLDLFDTVPLVKYQWTTKNAQGVSFDGMYGGTLAPNSSEVPKICPARWGLNVVTFHAIGKIVIINDFQNWENVTDSTLSFNIDSSMVFQ